MLKAVIFDFGQTLANSADGFKSAEKDVQGKIFSQLSVPSKGVFLSVYRRIRKEYHTNSDFSREAMWIKVFLEFGEVADPECLKNWENIYWQTVKENTRLFPETQQVLEKLSEEYRLALITNTQGQKLSGTHRISDFPELEPLFSEIIVAGEDGIPPKPDPAPFLHCLKCLEITPTEAVYVGDDWRIDICGARGVGITPVWLQHYAVPRSWPVVENSTPTITRLDRLFELTTIFL